MYNSLPAEYWDSLQDVLSERFTSFELVRALHWCERYIDTRPRLMNLTPVECVNIALLAYLDTISHDI